MHPSWLLATAIVIACSTKAKPPKQISNDIVTAPDVGARGDDHVAEVLTTAVGTCARMTDGSVRCWGASDAGETLVPKPIAGVTSAVQLFGAQSGQCARRSDGRVQCWGLLSHIGEHDKPVYFVDVLTNAEDAWMGNGDGCARLRNGRLVCWGMHVGLLATGGAPGPAPVLPALRDAAEIALRSHHGCARMKDSTVACWGMNDSGQLGDGTTVERPTPVPVRGLRDVAQVVVGESFSCARLADGATSCWGANHDGQLGDNSMNGSPIPKRIANLADVVELAAGDHHVCARHRDRTVTCWGMNQSGELGRGSTADDGYRGGVPAKVAGLTEVIQLSASHQHSCAVHATGTLSCWGANRFGLLGDGTQINRSTPVSVKWRVEQRVSRGLPAGVRVRSIGIGVDHTCAGLDDGTVRCWGGNEDGQLTAGSKSDPLAVPTPVPNLAKVATLRLGTMTTTATREDGTTVGWGRQRKGMQPDPEEPSLCKRAADGTVSCTHEASREQLRDTTALVTNEYFACALMKNRSVQCTGSNHAGQLGDNTTTNRAKFAPVPTLTDVVQLVGGDSHACVRRADRTVWCWGGDQTRMMHAPLPREVSGLRDAEEVFSGPHGACARRTSGGVACWWWYAVPFTNTAFDPDRIVLEPVSWLQGAKLIALGEQHGCALIADELACWGDNTRGQLGDGTFERRDRATLVRW